jgi:hypothetical protein
MSRRRPAIDEACTPNVTLDEVEAETEIGTEAVDRSLDLFARWALHQGRQEGILPEVSLTNRVTPDGIKGYGGNDGSN